MTPLDRLTRRLEELRARRPLIHNITNYVVMNSTANLLLALGAAPVMAHAEEEVEELAAISGALVLNIGTLSGPWIAAMFKAATAAKTHGVPIVLDPVGAGATRLRTETARRLLAEQPPAVLRGNASEILALQEGGPGARGVDARHTVDQARHAARELARRFSITVAVTGPEDYVTNGTDSARIANGHPLLAQVTGTGCAASAITGAFLAVEPDPLAAAAQALVVFGVAGEIAATGNPGPGTFAVRLIDALAAIDTATIRERARLVIGPA